ncbi:HET-domain-containing protein [Mytilinidion resinicola]|uniref:HET-domain-containing protein n=1 Tax=Mytilinidion resinicola TaxID=574789 RepID=A0A6A6Z3M8_9PEZI|nr:HET-domain-containing protein [Mytilinidion resinicola]KAF2814857.1 HET-domain-containing protein [Mytilinidion resinicola]
MAQIDMSLVRTWVQQCDQSREHRCSRTSLTSRWPTDFKVTLIDVHRHCITQVDPTRHRFRYLALSYVWGKISQLELTKNNIATLADDESLTRLSDSLPQVIKDAMTVVYKLGERYLWVDSLCIVQDDSEVKHDLISRMANIYDNAYLTICAVDGVHANVGLPGVRPFTRVFDSIGETTRLRIARRPSRLSKVVFSSYYNDRGWTFQERLLSRRCLYFTKEQVYFQCKSNIYCEDRYERRLPTDGWRGGHVHEDIRLLSPLRSPLRGDFPAYSRIVSEYTAKSLSFTSDKLNAITGVLYSLRLSNGWQFLYGIPVTLLGLSLIWVPTGQARRHIEREPLNMFPSWSWIGWEGVVDYNIMLTGEEWTERPKMNTCIVLSAVEVLGAEVTYKESIALAPDLALPGPNSPLCHYPSGRTNVLHLWGPVAAATEFTFDMFFPNPTRLGKLPCNIAHPIVRVRDHHGRCCGAIYGVDSEDISTFRSRECGLVLISETSHVQHLQFSESGLSIPAYDAQHFHTRYSHNDGCSVYNVMLVAFEEELSHFCERLAVGQIHADAWSNRDANYMYIHLV